MVEDYSKIIKELSGLLRKSNLSNIRELYKNASYLYDAMYDHYDYCEETMPNGIKEKTQYRICQLLDEEVLPKLESAMSATKSDTLRAEIIELHKKCFALSARRVMRNFAFYIELGKTEKVWSDTMDTMRCVFDYEDKFLISDTFNMLRVSCMPGLGKSYNANLLVANIIGNDANAKILRISYSDELVESSTEQTKAIIKSEEFSDIFPRYKGVKKLFRRETLRKFVMCDCDDQTQFNATTRDGQANGKRAKYVIIDDLLKGEEESCNVELHNKYVRRFYSDWSSRAFNDKQKTVLVGTMWADTDLLNVMYDKAKSKGLVQDKNYKWVEFTKDMTSAFITIPALDENDESVIPKRYSTASLHATRENLTSYLWMAVYQQNPIAPEGLEFNWASLRQYEALPESKDIVFYASLDPARKGKNYVSMPIFAKIDDVFYLVDWLYKKKSMDELYDEIIDKIVKYRLSHLVIENNTDTSLKFLLNEKLRSRSYFGCTIVEKYSSQNKEQRIKDNQGYIRNNMVFPRQGLYSLATEIGKAMEALVYYSFDYPNKFDDAPDSAALFSAEFIKKSSRPVRAKAFNRRALGM